MPNCPIFEINRSKKTRLDFDAFPRADVSLSRINDSNHVSKRVSNTS